MKIINRSLLALLPLSHLGYCENSSMAVPDSQARQYLATESGIDSKSNPEGITYLFADCLRAKGNRSFAYPAEGHRLVVNPPVFYWPMDDYEYPTKFPQIPHLKDFHSFSRYDFELCQDKEFKGDSLKRGSGLHMPFYNVHKALKSGTWYWRYRVSKEKGENSWSKTHEVEVPEDTPKFESPTASEAFAKLSDTHPRVFGDILNVKPNDWNKPMIKSIRKNASKAMSRSLEDYVVKGKPIPKDATPDEILQIKRFRQGYELGGLCGDVKKLLKAYQLGGDEASLERALELCDNLLKRDVPSIYKDSDFRGAMIMTTLAAAYDIHVYSLSEAERKPYEETISKVIELIISHQMEGNVGSGDGILGAHFFQHVFLDVFKSTVVMKGHVAEDKKWFNLLYNIWLSRTPGGGIMDDGAWPNGNQGYMHVNMGSMVDNYLFFKREFGINLFSHPWYQRCATALIYTYPAHSVGDGFGDGAKNNPPRDFRADFAYILGRETGNPYAIRYAYDIKNLNPDEPYRFSKDYFSPYRLTHGPEPQKSKPLSDLPTAAAFPQTGQVAMTSSLGDASKNLLLSFRSSPFGAGSHGHAEQNSFNLAAHGKPVFYTTGYRVTTRDKHYLLCQKHSRAKNTITVNGKTQTFGHNGYGWIGRYLHGERISYAMGDASRAYQPLDKSSINWETVLNTSNVYKANEGFILSPEDDPEVRLFRRHIALLRPSTIIIYDELKADKPVTWTWRLNGPESSNMRLDEETGRIIADTDWVDGAADIFGSSPLRRVYSDEYHIKPVDWLNPQRGRPAKVFDSKQFSTKTENAEKTKVMRFFAVIQLDDQNKLTFDQVKTNEKGEFLVNGYKIHPELDISKPARLAVNHQESGARLLYGDGEEADGSKRKFTRSTLLFEKKTGWQESADTLPLMLPPHSTTKK